MATMNKAIEQYMAQGYSRVQAIKLFYEKIKNQKNSPLSPTPSMDQSDTKKKNNRLSLPPQSGKVKYAIERFNANKNAEIVGPEVKRNPDAPASKWGALKSKLKGTGRPNLSLIAAAALAAKNAAAAGNNTDGATAGSGATSQRGSINGGSDTDDLAIDAHEHSPIRAEGMNHSFGRGSPKHFDPNNPPLSVGRPLNLVPMSQIHRKFFPHSQDNGDPIDPDYDEDEDDEDDDEEGGDDDDDASLDTSEPTPENVLAFLHSVKYSSEERDEFLIMIDKGRDIDEASHAIFSKRLRAYEKAGQEMQLKNGERLPLRYSSMAGHRSNDLELLLRQSYTLAQANYIVDVIYAWQHGAKNAPPPLKPTLGSVASTGKVALAVQKFSSLRKKSNSTSEATAGDHHNNPNISLAKRALLQAAKAQKEANEAHAANIPESQRRQHPEASIEVKQAPSLELDDMQEIEAEEEHAMRIAELVMEQEELYGVNMYDCLEPADEDKIEELVGLGYTVDDAILHIFEEKVVIPLERPTTPQSHHSNQSSHHSNNVSIKSNKTPEPQEIPAPMHAQRLEEEFAEKLHVQEPPMVEHDEFEEEEEQEKVVPPVQYMTPPPEEPVDYQIAEDLELEIALLMRKGYTREHAVRFLLDRTSEEVMQTEPQQSYSMKPSNGYEALTPPSSGVPRDSSRSRTTSTAEPSYTYPTMMLPPTGSHRTNGSGSSVGSGSRTASSGGSRSHHSSPAYQDVPTPPASYSSRRPSSNNTPTQHRPSNGNMYNMNQDDMNGYPSQLQHQQSSSSRRPSVAVEDYNQPRYDPYENQMNNAGYHGSGSGKQVPFLRLPNQQLEEEYDGPTEIDMDENDDDISHLTDPTIMTGPSFPQQHQHQPQYPPQVPYPSHGPQGIQYASYPPQPPPQIQQHIYVNQAHVPQAYRPPPPKPPVIHINPQAPLLPMQYNTNLPTHLHIYNRQDDRNLSNINADERALRIGLLVSEQEAQYGINMYDDIHAGDEPFLHRLIQSGYNEDEAVLIIFEIKHGPPNSHYVSKEPLPPQSAMKRQVSSGMAINTPQPPQRPAPIIHINSNSSNIMNSPAPFHHQNSTSSAKHHHNNNNNSNNGMMNSPAPFHHQNSSSSMHHQNSSQYNHSNNNQSNNNNYHSANSPSQSSYMPSPAPPQRGLIHNNSQQHSRSLMAPSPGPSHNASMDSLEFAMQISRQESEYVPGAVRMPGMAERNNNPPQRRPSQHVPPSNSAYPDLDPESLRTLTGMGFAMDMAAFALRNKNHDVNQALEFLLGGA